MAYQIIIILSCILACSAQFTDDMQIYEAECLGENRIHCGDGRCIWQEQYCDGNVDCADGSDENLCLEHTPDPVLCNTTHQFMCTDKKKCLPVSWLCNNDTDCEDGSDEANCTFNEISKNATCKGFTCKSDGRCISRLWACDGSYDCADLSDEDPVACKALLIYRWKYYPSACDGHSILMLDRSYRCLDSSFCLASWMMCDGLPDCRDGSDEGAFCHGWTDQCLNHTCGNDDRAFCTRSRDGPECVCRAYSTFNSTTRGCVAMDMCSEARPVCPQQCTHHDGPFLCTCEEGYTSDRLGIGDVCFAAGPEAMLFFTTRNDIRYMKRSTKQVVTVVTGIKEAHGVSYDGQYLYWVETAEGHQAIIRAHLENVEETKQVLVSLGLEDPGDIAVDWQGGHVYFSDAERGVISACRVDGSICTTVNTDARMPKFVTLDPRNGSMYWADWHGRPLIMRARMDGSSAAPLVDALRNFPSGLALDAPSHRLYYVDTVLMGVNIDNGKIFSVFEEPRHHPYGVAVFENAVYWSDWATDSIQVTDKLLGAEQRTSVVLKLKTPIYHLHVYHPILMKAASNPCDAHRCSHLCLLRSNETFTCACPEGMELEDNYTCQHIKGYRPLYLVVGGGASFTRIQYNALGNPETHAAYFNIGRVQAMAYDSLRDTLYVYDAHHKGINYISMAEFTLGVTHLLLYKGLENVVDMDYDYVSDSLYILDAGRRFVEVVSLRTQKRALLHRFDDEVPISFCVLPDYGKMLVAVSNSENKEEIHIDSIGLDGSARQHIVMNNLKGPRVQLRYAHNMGLVYVADEGNRVIDFMHPQGTGRETFVELSSSVMTLAVGDSLAFWAFRRAQRLYWADVHRSRPTVRRLDLSIFPNTSLLHLQITFPTSNYSTHPCQLTPNPCSDVCVQIPTALTLGSLQSTTGSQHHTELPNAGYKCLCPPGLLNLNGKCTALIVCKEDEAFCHRSDICIRKTAVCDGKPDCFDGEDEEDCPAVEPSNTSLCQYNEIICNGVCMHESGCSASANASTTTVAPICSAIEFECSGDRLCISRSQLCDGAMDCDDGSDEAPAFCDTLNCLPTEFMCSSGTCILASFRCDGDDDCIDGSDEVGCESKTCAAGYSQCRSTECVELGKRCDGHADCADGSDEDGCEEPDYGNTQEEVEDCAEWEYPCELNRSICIPATARCNGKMDCPGNTDEVDCVDHCAPYGLFECPQEARCISKRLVCDGRKDCADASDEAPDACLRVNRTSSVYAPLSAGECVGFRCASGQCVDWGRVCDQSPDCFDGTDEGGLCFTACENNTCAQQCRPTPLGGVCACAAGYSAEADGRCRDEDECGEAACAQRCRNTPGSYSCGCHRGYALRSDRRSCKAVSGNMSVVYVTGNSVRSVTADGRAALEFNDRAVGGISDMDCDVRRKKLYVASTEAGKIIEVNGTHGEVVITNIGRPTRVAVDWVTGNVYFSEGIGAGPVRVRVCLVRTRRCARLQLLPKGAQVTALIVDPASRLMFYCVSSQQESVVWSATLSGRRVNELAVLHNCTGLAVDSFKRLLYVAETAPAHILQMDFEGNGRKKILTNDPLLEAPHGLAIFEDHIYYLVANSFKLNRCSLFSSKHCDVYVQRIFDANTFVIRHESVQRDDVANICEGVTCANVCVLDDAGPVCVCDDGSVAKETGCPVVDKSELPLFNGWTSHDFVNAQHYSTTLIASAVTLVVIYLCIFFYYHFVYKKKNNRPSTYIPVHFQNSMTEDSEGLSAISTPIVSQMPATGSESHEFVNPLQYIRDVWRQSFRKRTRPVGTAGLTINVPPLDCSDTESDLDDRETQRIIRKK